MNLNRAMIIGNLTRDPELRATPNGQSVCNFGVATNRYWTGQDGQRQEQVEFHNIVAWGKLAEICSQYLGKGRKVYIEGRLQTREWEGQDGSKRKTTEIVAENMIMLDKAGAGAPSGDFSGGYDQGSSQAQAPQEPAGIDDEIKVEDIPF